MEQAQNVLSNAIAPVDFRKAKQLVGTVEYVAAEVLVSKIVRTVLRWRTGVFLNLPSFTYSAYHSWAGLRPPSVPSETSIQQMVTGRPLWTEPREYPVC